MFFSRNLVRVRPSKLAGNHLLIRLKATNSPTKTSDANNNSNPIEEVTGLDIARLMTLSSKYSQNIKSKHTPLRFFGEVFQRLNKIGEEEPQPATNDMDMKPLPKTRKMADSYIEMDLNFSRDPKLREAYIGANTDIRMGRLMEDFDVLAGKASYKHCLPDEASLGDAKKHGFYLVTAAVDRMDLLHPLHNANGKMTDLRLSGHVSFTSSSSLEVFMRMSSIVPEGSNEKPITFLLARFAMASRSVHGGKFPIPQLELESPEEKELFDAVKKMRDRKRTESQESLYKKPPNAEEASRMHDLFIGRGELFEKHAVVPPEIVWMSDTELNGALMMHPQERNVHSKIFGGYLMRLAFESAYSTACLFAHSHVEFISLDELQFVYPVEIGSLLTLRSRVTYVPIVGEHKSFHVSVQAGTRDLLTGEQKITNVFHYTFASDKPLTRHVLPRSYRQTMQWLDARRRRESGIEIRNSYKLEENV